MLKGFKDFILKGNVIDLATAVIIGAAFTAIVTAFADGVVQPLLAALPIRPDGAEGLGFFLGSTEGLSPEEANAIFVNLGAVITAVLNFLIVAAIIYFVIIVPYNKLSELGGFGSKSEVTEVSLLTEIRDLLAPEGESSPAREAAVEGLPTDLREGFDDAASGPKPTIPGGPDGPGSAATRTIASPPQGGQYGAPQGPGQSGYAPSGPGQPGPGQSGPQGTPPPGNYPPPPGSGPAPGTGPTPPPAPGAYPPPGNYPPGSYPPPPGGQYPPQGGQYPGEFPDDGGRHSR